jgi:tellurite resistance protein
LAEPSASLSVKIGMAVAMADGSLDDAEGEVLKHWIKKTIAPFSDEKRESLKSLYNDALRESYQQAKSGDLILSKLTERMNEIGEKSAKYETIELCFEVMAADGVADAEELSTIHKVAEALDLDFDEVTKMRDQTIVDLDASASTATGIESLLGIDPSWSKEQTKKHLRSEFQKWNNRLNALPDGDERNNAQAMLGAIAEARQKYA